MRLLVTDSPQPFLFRRTILVQGKEEICWDLREILHCAGLPSPALLQDADQWTIPKFLSLFCNEPSGLRERINQTLSLFMGDHQQIRNAVNVYDQRAVVLRKPIESCSKVIIVGHRSPINRRQEGTRVEMVTGFLKFASALADPDAKVQLPNSDGIFDADAVLGVVIGKRTERIPITESLSCIAGFTLLADITDRKTFEVECRTNNSLLAKNHYGLSPIGPCIWIARDRRFDEKIKVTFKLNGQVRQQFTLGDLAYGFKEMISFWSRLILEPGDILGLGATIVRPQTGEIFESPIPIRPGDVLEVESPLIGLLKVEIV